MAIITTREALAEVVEEYMAFDEFVFDLETYYDAPPDEREQYELLKAKRVKDRTVDEQWIVEIYELKATDPTVNEIHWIGLAGPGGSSHAIPVGHPKGRQTRPARKEKMEAWEVYGLDDARGLTPNGAPSKRAVQVNFPAEFAPAPEQLPIEYVIEALRPLFFSSKLIINQQIKFDVKTIQKYFGDWPTMPLLDLILAQHLLNEKLKNYQLGPMTQRHFKKTYDKLGKKGVHNFSFGQAARYVTQDTRYTYLLWRKFRERIQRQPTLWRFLNDYLIYFYEAIMLMEHNGIYVDTEAVTIQRAEKEKEIAGIIDRLIVDYGAPRDFNPNADAQKRELVYEKYKGRITKKTEKTEMASVDRESLEAVTEQLVYYTDKVSGERLSRPHKAAPVAQLLLDYQDQHKVLSTYLVSTLHRLDSQGRVHPDFLLHGTETSRLSCREPNIQNIPRESEMRGIYVAPPGHVFIIGDYDQIELRKIAVEADDPTLMGLFNSGQDVHRGTAALVLAKDFDDTDDEERQTYGKMPNFLVGYGGSAYNLAEKTGISEKHAQSVIDGWYKRFKRIQPWKDKVVREARNRAEFRNINGQRTMTVPPYVETMLGRRRRLPELFWDDRKAQRRAERQAVNTIIQGGASETALLAMVAITAWARKEKFPLGLNINVHDEIVGTVPVRLADEAKDTFGELMREVRVPHTGERPLKDKVPLAAKVVLGEKWLK